MELSRNTIYGNNDHKALKAIAVGQVFFSKDVFDDLGQEDNIETFFKNTKEFRDGIIEETLSIFTLEEEDLKAIKIKTDGNKNSIKVYVETFKEELAIELATVACLNIYRKFRKEDTDISIGNIKLVKKCDSDYDFFIKENISGEIMTVNRSTDGERSLGLGEEMIVLAIESIVGLIDSRGSKVDNGYFNEDFTTKGMLLYELPIETKLVAGDSIQEVVGSHKVEFKGLEKDKTIHGIITRVIKPGTIRYSDTIKII